jgi:hypothetical protein
MHYLCVVRDANDCNVAIRLGPLVALSVLAIPNHCEFMSNVSFMKFQKRCATHLIYIIAYHWHRHGRKHC